MPRIPRNQPKAKASLQDRLKLEAIRLKAGSEGTSAGCARRDAMMQKERVETEIALAGGSVAVLRPGLQAASLDDPPSGRDRVGDLAASVERARLQLGRKSGRRCFLPVTETVNC